MPEANVQYQNVIVQATIIIYLIIYFVSFTGLPDDPRMSPRSRTTRQQSKIGRPPLTQQQQVMGSPNPSPTPSRSNSREPLYKSTSLETRSRTPSPSETINQQSHDYYGRANLTDRSRSPSPPTSTAASTVTGVGLNQLPPTTGLGGSTGGLNTLSKRPGRRLPPTPNKPSSLNIPKSRGGGPSDDQQLQQPHMPKVLPSPTIAPAHKSPGSINFPRLNASPTRLPQYNIPPSSRLGTGGQSTNKQAERQHHHHPNRPQPFSPTEKNDLNMPQSFRTRERLTTNRRTSSQDMLDNRERSSHIPRSYSGQLVDRYQHSDNRMADTTASAPTNRFELQPQGGTGPNSGPVGQGRTLPNGFKPRRGVKNKKQVSESDDEDWC